MFSSTHCLLQDTILKKKIEIGSLTDGLYKLHVDAIKCSASCTSDLLRSSTCSKSAIHNCTLSSTTLWHARLGHAPISVLKQVLVEINCSTESHCDVSFGKTN